MQERKAVSGALEEEWDACFRLFESTSREYLKQLTDEDTPVGVVNAKLRERPMPTSATDLPKVFEEVCAEIVPQLSAQRGGKYFAYVTGGSTPAGTVSDWLVGLFDQNVKKDGCSIASDVERQTIRWLCELFLLPDAYKGIFTTGCTAANFLGLLAGRQHAGMTQGVDVTLDGVAAARIRVFCSSPHESMLKVIGFSGLGQRNLIRINRTSLTDEAMDIADLEKNLKLHKDCGLVVIASAGTVSGTAFDDLVAIRTLCDRYNAWMHVDGAFGLYERLLTGVEGRTKGIDRADSIALDCHKWMNVPYDSGACLVRDSDMLKEACYVDTPYFASRGPEYDFLTLGIENSRRFRAFPVWFSLLAYGSAGITEWVERNVRLARLFATWVDGMDCFEYELVHYGGLNVVLFRPSDRKNRDFKSRTHNIEYVTSVQSDDGSTDNTGPTSISSQHDCLTLKYLRLINERGRLFINGSIWNGQRVLRLAISSYSTNDEHMAHVRRELSCVATVLTA